MKQQALQSERENAVLVSRVAELEKQTSRLGGENSSQVLRSRDSTTQLIMQNLPFPVFPSTSIGDISSEALGIFASAVRNYEKAQGANFPRVKISTREFEFINCMWSVNCPVLAQK